MTTTKHELAAQVMLQHRLNNLLRISDTVEIDTSYITCAEYQLFIDEKLKQGEYRQPDHWKDTRFPKGDARKPIAGVRPSDGVSFCAWLRDREYSPPYFIFRLPTQSETLNLPIRDLVTQGQKDRIEFEQIQTWLNDQSIRALKLKSFDTSRPSLVKSLLELAKSLSTLVSEQAQNTLMQNVDRLTLEKGQDFSEIMIVTNEDHTSPYKQIVVTHARFLANDLVSEISSLPFKESPRYDEFRMAPPGARSSAEALYFAHQNALELRDFSKNLSFDRDYLEKARILVTEIAKQIKTSKSNFNWIENEEDIKIRHLASSFGEEMAFVTSNDPNEKLKHALDTRSLSQTPEVLRQSASRFLSYAILFQGALNSKNAYGKEFIKMLATNNPRIYIETLLEHSFQAFAELWLLNERISGRLPAWEGIRIVRERIA